MGGPSSKHLLLNDSTERYNLENIFQWEQKSSCPATSLPGLWFKVNSFLKTKKQLRDPKPIEHEKKKILSTMSQPQHQPSPTCRTPILVCLTLPFQGRGPQLKFKQTMSATDNPAPGKCPPNFKPTFQLSQFNPMISCPSWRSGEQTMPSPQKASSICLKTFSMALLEHLSPTHPTDATFGDRCSFLTLGQSCCPPRQTNSYISACPVELTWCEFRSPAMSAPTHLSACGFKSRLKEGTGRQLQEQVGSYLPGHILQHFPSTFSG